MFEPPAKDSLERDINDLSSSHSEVRGIAISNLREALCSQAIFPLMNALIIESKHELKIEIIRTLLLMKENGILEKAPDSQRHLRKGFTDLFQITDPVKEEERDLLMIFYWLWPEG